MLLKRGRGRWGDVELLSARDRLVVGKPAVLRIGQQTVWGPANQVPQLLDVSVVDAGDRYVPAGH